MRTAVSALAMILAAAAMPIGAQESTTEAFDEAFADEAANEAAGAEYHEAKFGEWVAVDGLTSAASRRVFMRKELGPERFLDVDLFEGGMASVTFLDPECSFGASFDVQELGRDRAAALAERFEDLLDTDSCNAREAVPSAEELAEPLAQLAAWVAERPFPAAGYWKPETRPLELGRGEGRGVSRYEGTVGIVYLEPDRASRGPAEIKVNIYECDAFRGRTLPVASGDPAEAQAIALAVLEERAEACGLDPQAPARLTAGLVEGLAAMKEYYTSAEADDWNSDEPDEPYEPEENDPLDAQTY